MRAQGDCSAGALGGTGGRGTPLSHERGGEGRGEGDTAAARVQVPLAPFALPLPPLSRVERRGRAVALVGVKGISRRLESESPPPPSPCLSPLSRVERRGRAVALVGVKGISRRLESVSPRLPHPASPPAVAGGEERACRRVGSDEGGTAAARVCESPPPSPCLSPAVAGGEECGVPTRRFLLAGNRSCRRRAGTSSDGPRARSTARPGALSGSAPRGRRSRKGG